MLLAENLVVDSSAFIKCLSIQDYGGKIFTVEEVLKEVKDKNTRERLSTLPFEINFKQPHPHSIKFVTEFSKQTGDYGSLSAIDLKLLALTYDLEKELVGSCDHLRVKPPDKECVISGGQRDKHLPLGFYTPTTADKDKTCDDGDDDGGGWITEEDLKSGSTIAPEIDCVKVACMTTDYAMQNVLIQIGLRALSVDGLLISTTHRFINRCYGCFRLCGDTAAVFCPHCGNRTLKRVSVSVSDDGRLTYTINPNAKINTRSLNAPLPRPQGGKHAVQVIVRPDQRVPHQRASRKSMQRTDALDPDYHITAGAASPFVHKDVTSRAFNMGHTRKQPHTTRQRRKR